MSPLYKAVPDYSSMLLTAFLPCPQNVLWSSEALAGQANLAGALRGGGGWTPKPGRCPDFDFQQFLISEVRRLVVSVVLYRLSTSTSEAPGRAADIEDCRVSSSPISPSAWRRSPLGKQLRASGFLDSRLNLSGSRTGVCAEHESRLRNRAMETRKRAICSPS